MAVLLLLGMLTQPAGPPSEALSGRIASILASRCVRCHGGTSTKGGLAVTTRDAILRGGESGPAIESGKPEESLLIEKITGSKPDMPRGGQALTADEVALFRRWIEEGAPWPEALVLEEVSPVAGPWWAIQPLNKPAIPRVESPTSLETPIDAFLLARLESKGLTFRPKADRRVLLRRLSYDLTGLPPTPDEMAAFLEDRSPDAYERLVDRLLASPRYGERWARHWLDVVHYADTHGYDKDKRRPNAWPYRDYVIASLNADKPYARFLEEQVAGDALFPGDPEATIATGFIAAGPWDFVGHVELREGTVEKQKTRLLDRDDMVANTISTFTSLTVHCARCHDHKFDPISQRDYYRLQAVFAGVDRGDRPIDDPEYARRKSNLASRRDDLDRALRKLNDRISALSSPELAKLDRDLARWRQELDALRRPEDEAPSPSNGYHSRIEPKPDVTKWVQVDLGQPFPIEEIRLVPARPVDFPDTPGFGFPARYRVELADDPAFTHPRIIADETDADTVNPASSWRVIRPAGIAARFVRITASKLWPRRNDYVFALAELQVLSGGRNVASRAAVTALDSIEAGRWSTRNLVDGFDSRTSLDRPDDRELHARRSELFYQIRQTEVRRQALTEALIPASLRAERKRIQAAVDQAAKDLAALPAPPQVYALISHPPRPIHVLHRGDVEQPRELASPGALSCVPLLAPVFPDTADEGARRAALAHWLSDHDNVLTWRSIVNRVWHYHFGRGIVDSPNDFGHNGGSPSHPELLDWLAATFRDDLKGSLKSLHRLIVLSATYRQTSDSDARAARIDADNRLLWRQNRRRLEAEEIRDAVLFVSDRLDPRMGGPGFDLFRFQDDHSPVYDHDDPAWIDPPAGRRRTIYRFTVRSVPNPMLECLDGADPNTNVPVRNTTITALQALTLLNDPFLIAQAQAFASSLHGNGSRRPAGLMINEAFIRAIGRPPQPSERDALASFAERYGLAAACRLIFNLNEFVFID